MDKNLREQNGFNFQLENQLQDEILPFKKKYCSGFEVQHIRKCQKRIFNLNFQKPHSFTHFPASSISQHIHTQNIQ